MGPVSPRAQLVDRTTLVTRTSPLTVRPRRLEIAADPADDGSQIEINVSAGHDGDRDVTGDAAQVGVAGGDAVDPHAAAGGAGRDRGGRGADVDVSARRSCVDLPAGPM